MARFKDHFSTRAADYAAFRPSYPPELIAHLAGLAPGRDLAWDAATGNGQAAALLAAHFRQVVGTDASPQQIDRASADPRVVYRVAREADSGLESGSVDLVTVAQALHWLDLPAFYGEVRRVLRPGGVLAAWSYARVSVDAGVDPIVEAFYSQRVGRYWPYERRHVEDGYRGLAFPFEEIPAGRWAMTARPTRQELLGYIGTWSAVTRARDAEGLDPMVELERDLRRVWPGDAERRLATWPISLKVGR